MPILNTQQLRALMEQRGATGFLVPVMVAGALTESNGVTDAVGDHGHSVGLFQLHDQGRGIGMTVAQRMDPNQNVDRMLPFFREGLAVAEQAGLVGEDRATRAYMEAERPAGFPSIQSEAANRFRGKWRSLNGMVDNLATGAGVDALLSQIGFLTDNVAAALEDALGGAEATDPAPPQERQDAYQAIRAAIDTLRGHHGPHDGASAGDLETIVAVLTGDVAAALQAGLDGAEAADPEPPAERQEAYSALQAAISTLRRGGV